MKKIISYLICIVLLLTLTSCGRSNSKYNQICEAFSTWNTNVISEEFKTPFGTKSIVLELIDEKIKISGKYYDSTTSNNYIIIIIWQEDSSSITITDYNGKLCWAQYEHKYCMESYIKNGYLTLEKYPGANGKSTVIGDIFLDDVDEYIDTMLGVVLR